MKRCFHFVTVILVQEGTHEVMLDHTWVMLNFMVCHGKCCDPCTGRMLGRTGRARFSDF